MRKLLIAVNVVISVVLCHGPVVAKQELAKPTLRRQLVQEQLPQTVPCLRYVEKPKIVTWYITAADGTVIRGGQIAVRQRC